MVASTWQNFESFNLGALPSNWTLNDAATRYSISTSGESKTISTVNGVADTGTHGLALSFNSTTAAYIYTNFGGLNPASAVASFWYIVPAIAAATHDNVCQWTTGAGTPVVYLDLQNNSGTLLYRWIGTTTVNSINPVAGTTNWITMQAATNATCTVRIYNNVGTELTPGAVTVTGTANPLALCILGDFSGPGTAAATTSYYDDLVFSFTGVYPLGP